MKVVGKPKLEEFWRAHPTAKNPLRRWLRVTQNAGWNKFADVKRTFGSADWFSKENRDYIIFNVGGNKFRVVTAVNFGRYLVVVEVVMTHSNYSNRKWENKL